MIGAVSTVRHPQDERRQDDGAGRHRDAERDRAGNRRRRPKNGTAIPVLLKSRSPCIATIAFCLERAQDGERRAEAVVDRDLRDPGARVEPPAGALDAREDVRNEDDVDRLIDLARA